MAEVYWYGSGLTAVADGSVDLAVDTLTVSLLANSYAPNQEVDSSWANISGNEVSGTGYSSENLTSVTWTYDGSNIRKVLSADNVSWPDSTIDARWGVIRAGDDLILLLDFESIQSSEDGTFSLEWNSDGIAHITATAL